MGLGLTHGGRRAGGWVSSTATSGSGLGLTRSHTGRLLFVGGFRANPSQEWRLSLLHRHLLGLLIDDDLWQTCI